MSRTRSWNGFAAAVAASFLALASPAARAVDGAGASDGVPLRLMNVIVRPDHRCVLAIRTCQPRGLSQGQILIRRPTDALPVVRRVKVFSTQNDAESLLLPTGDDTAAFTAFTSPSATVNAHHGPLLALLLAPEPSFVPGETLPVDVIATSTELLDANGNPTPFTTFSATITVCDPDAPYVVGVRDAQAMPGRTAVIGIVSFEFERFRHAAFVVRYDPTLLVRNSGSVVWDVRGDVTAQIDSTVPGEVSVTLDSPHGSIALLPGSILDLDFDVSPLAVAGQTSTIDVAPDSALLVDRDGNAPLLELLPGTLTIVAPTPP
jgi:hypothetical protein